MEDIHLVSAFGESRDLVSSPSRSNLGLVSSRLVHPVANREIYNLSMVSVPVKKRKKFDFHTFGDQQTKQKTKQFDDID